MGTTPRKSSASQRLALILLGCALPFLVSEIVLQAGSWFAWRRASTPTGVATSTTQDPDRQVVLCLGDSFTYGSGSSSASLSYPRQLNEILAAQTPPDSQRDWTVINGGRPGRNSAELMQRLPGYLRREKPDYVCILIGCNNRWNRTDTDLTLPDLESGEEEGFVDWQWRWRTLRFLAIAWGGIPSDEEVAPEDEEEETLPPARPPTPRPDTKRPKFKATRVQREIRARLGQATRAFGQDNDGVTLTQTLSELQPELWGADDPVAVRKYLRILFSLRHHEKLRAETTRAIEKFGETPQFLQFMIDPVLRLGDPEGALRYGHRALELSGDDPIDPFLYRCVAQSYQTMLNWPKMVEYYLRAFDLDNDSEYLGKRLKKVSSIGENELLQTIQKTLAGVDLDAMKTAKVQMLIERILDEATREKGGAESRDSLDRHLTHMVALIRRSGAQPILLCYPNIGRSRDIGGPQRRVARREQVPFVDLPPVFDDLLRSAPPETYFIPDGHCNDTGYGIIAEQVARTLTELESRSSVPANR